MIEKLRQSAQFIKEKSCGFAPEAVLVLGSGLGSLADEVKNAVILPYSDIPHFPVSTAPGHAGRLVLGELAGRRAAVMQGRFHYYEGYSYAMSVYGLRALRLLGAQTLVVTNAAGGLGYGFCRGDIMLIIDHLKFFDESPLRGENIEELGTRFPDMTYTYTPALQKTAREAAAELGTTLREGVYMYFPGPQYETPAEIRAAKTLGADAVGMSTVPEAIAAAHAGMDVLGFSLICNMAAGLQVNRLSEKEVLDTAEVSKERFSKLVLRCLEKLPPAPRTTSF